MTRPLAPSPRRASKLRPFVAVVRSGESPLLPLPRAREGQPSCHSHRIAYAANFAQRKSMASRNGAARPGALRRRNAVSMAEDSNRYPGNALLVHIPRASTPDRQVERDGKLAPETIFAITSHAAPGQGTAAALVSYLNNGGEDVDNNATTSSALAHRSASVYGVELCHLRLCQWLSLPVELPWTVDPSSALSLPYGIAIRCRFGSPESCPLWSTCTRWTGEPSANRRLLSRSRVDH